MEYLDLLPVLRAREEGPGLFYDHCHYTPLGNEIIAAAVYEKLLSMSGH